MASSYPPNPNEQDPNRDSQGYVPPSQGGYVPPSQGGYVPPSQGGYVPPAGGDYQSSGGYVPPAGGDYQASQGGYTPPPGGGYQAPSQGYAPQGNAPYGAPPPPPAKKGPLQNPLLLGLGALGLCACLCLVATLAGGRGIVGQVAATLTADAGGTNRATTVPGTTGNNPATRPTTDTSGGNTDVGGGQVSAFDVSVGQCFNDPGVESVNTLEVVDCSTPHDNEIFHLVDYDAGASDPFPGEGEIDALAQSECSAAFESYVGVDYNSSRFYVSYYQPSEATWAQGDREIICFLNASGEQLEGSVRGSGE